MLSKEEKLTAVRYARLERASILAEMAEGACVHGHYDYSLDMEYACLACEFGDGTTTPAMLAYSRAITRVKRERADIFLKFITMEISRDRSAYDTLVKIEFWLRAYHE